MSSSMSCYGGGSTAANLSPSFRNQYSTASPLAESSPRTSGFKVRGTLLDVSRQSFTTSRIQEDDDTLSALRETAPRLATMSAASENDRRRMLMPLRARSSLRSVRSARDANKYSMTTSAVHLTAEQASPSNLSRVTSHTTGPMQSQHTIASLRVERLSSISTKISDAEVSKPKKKSGIKSMFSFASFSKRSSSRSSVDISRPVDGPPQTPSPTKAVNEWMAIQDNELIRASSSSIGSGSRSGSSVQKAPNARRATNSIVSHQSTGERLSTSSRSSTFTRTSGRMIGPQRSSMRTPSPETQTVDGAAEALLKPPIQAPFAAQQRAASPASSRHTRVPSDTSDVVICDAATTSFFSAGRPKSIYDYRNSMDPGAGVLPDSNIRPKSVRIIAQRPRPQILHFASKAIQIETASASPTSSSSSVPSLTPSYTPLSTSPPSTPGSPNMNFRADAAYFSKRYPSHSWLDDDASSTSTRSASPPSSTSSPTLSTIPLRQSSLSPFTTTMLKAAAHNRTTTITRQPTQRSQNPYTTTPTAPFPTPSASPTSPYSSAKSPASPTEASYFRLPQSSSAHPSLYPDLLVKHKDGKTVGMDLTEEEAVLIACLRRKRMAMRREELEKLGKALGVTKEEGAGEESGS